MLDAEQLTPAQRIEVQDWLMRRWLALHTPRTPERRKSVRKVFRKRDWPHLWFRNDADYAYCARIGK